MRNTHILTILFTLLGVCAVASADEPTPRYFDINDTGAPDESVPVIEPWKTFDIDPEFGGHWVTAGDVDGDGIPEVVTAQNFNQDDVHYTSAVAVQKLDGSTLWHWGDPKIGRKNLHHDVACQVHDWDGDGKNEVVVLAKDAVVVLDGATGAEKQRFAIPEGASDCVTFCDLRGSGRPADLLVKTRYTQLWAYDQQGTLLWTVDLPGQYRTAHQPRPIDIDKDGRDEIMAGYAMLNPDGSVRWVYESKAVDAKRGHLDCVRVVKQGKTPEEWRLILTCCGAENIAMIDGEGTVLWEVPGRHFESVDAGHIIPGHAAPQLVVDVDHQPKGQSPIWILDADGAFLGRITTDYSRCHALLDWDGDGCDEIIVANNRAMYGSEGKRVATFGADGGGASIAPADMTGNGVPDVLLRAGEKIYIYKNEKGRKPSPPAQLGTGLNYTLY